MKKIISILLFFAGFIHAQISPGDLTRAHSHLEGMSNCVKCHEMGEAVTDAKCLACHTEIESLINLKRGYHSNNEVLSKNCFECHNEHHGVNFEMIRFDEKTFDHNKAGFELTGIHITIECSECHNTDFIKNEEIKKKEKTFLGLGTSCIDCHEDYHQNTLGSSCETCHDTKAFRPAPKFNHDQTDYKLSGKHKEVKCEGCHKLEERNGKEFQIFAGVSHNSCVSCHVDVHKNKFGSNCESCHSTNSFHQLVSTNTFGHSKTNFELIGLHQNVDCSRCHTAGYGRQLEYENCIDCHADYHRGELTKDNVLIDCVECHNEFGFKPSHFGLLQHEKTQFPLDGGHMAVPCIQCHDTGERWKFDFADQRCIGCHENVHGASLTEQYLGNNDCARCHNSDSWDNISFDHSATQFPLKGKHELTKCSKCHIITDENGMNNYTFSDVLMNCESCHKDPHYRQFRIVEETNCERCHAFDNWNPVNFNHDRTRFPLSGAHAKVECEKCHKEKELPTGTFIKYKFENTDCIVCHGENKQI